MSAQALSTRKARKNKILCRLLNGGVICARQSSLFGFMGRVKKLKPRRVIAGCYGIQQSGFIGLNPQCWTTKRSKAIETKTLTIAGMDTGYVERTFFPETIVSAVKDT